MTLKSSAERASEWARTITFVDKEGGEEEKKKKKGENTIFVVHITLSKKKNKKKKKPLSFSAIIPRYAYYSY